MTKKQILSSAAMLLASVSPVWAQSAPAGVVVSPSATSANQLQVIPLSSFQNDLTSLPGLSGIVTQTQTMTNTDTQYGINLSETVLGGGLNGPAHTRVGYNLNEQKQNWDSGSAATGEEDGIYVTLRNGGGKDTNGVTSDTSGLLFDVGCDGEGFCNDAEGVVTETPVGGSPSNSIHFQIGDVGDSGNVGFLAQLQGTPHLNSGATSTAFLADTQSTNSDWTQFFVGANHLGQTTYQINADGSGYSVQPWTFKGGVEFQGAAPASNYGAGYIGWNNSGGGGETDFWNTDGAGGLGGFRWYDYNTSTSAQIASLDKGGNLTASGNITVGSAKSIVLPNTAANKTTYLFEDGNGYVDGTAGGGDGQLDLKVNNIIVAPSTPSSSTAACIQGQLASDANYVYVCTATNNWKRSALSSF